MDVWWTFSTTNEAKQKWKLGVDSKPESIYVLIYGTRVASIKQDIINMGIFFYAEKVENFVKTV